MDTGQDLFVKGQVTIDESCALTTIDGNCDFTMPWGKLFSEGIEGETKTEDIVTGINRIFHLPFGYRTFTDEKHSRRHTEFHRFGEHCVIGTDGQLYHPRLMGIYNQADEILIKGMDPHIIAHSISTSPQFPQHMDNLRFHKIKSMFVDGWKLTHCAGDAAMAYIDQWIENVYIIRDLTNSVPPPYGDVELMIKKLRLSGVKFVNSDQLIPLTAL